jgi:hypothetical protein
MSADTDTEETSMSTAVQSETVTISAPQSKSSGSSLSNAVLLALRNMPLLRHAADEYKKKFKSKIIKWSYVFTVLGLQHLKHYEKGLIQDKYYCPNKNVGARTTSSKRLIPCNHCDYSNYSRHKLKIHICKSQLTQLSTTINYFFGRGPVVHKRQKSISK